MQCSVGAFLHSGQICMSTERILVHKSIFEPFCRQIKASSAEFFKSNQSSTALTMAQAAGVAKNKKLVGDAIAKGATLVYGDIHQSETTSYRLNPVIVGGVTKEMDLFYTESFGPSVSLIMVENDEEAVAIANDTDYGLSGAVFTESLARGLDIASKVESGAVHINSMTIHDEARLPHGGVKNSGWGRFNSQWGLDEFLKTKTVTFQTKGL
ncbi:hypothetical protein E8E13_011600 [Curvularia kusanoi]|uniref:Aldehyde dehydrogenase domain-containing protein n=1 Tax=Curvularia kusanoi TaxID=90978 RepID=A0A9P4TMX9_CURKU|nr:hypothetical protein E8E13_011600 [Curvularia kusanoi]